VKAAAAWIADRELWLLLLIIPLLVFPVSVLPFVAVGLTALVWACRWVARGRPSIGTAFDGATLILLIMTGVGRAVSVDPALSQSKVWGMVLGFVVFYAVANGVRGESQIVRGGVVLGVLALALAVASFLGTDWSNVRLVTIPAIYDNLPTLIRGLPGSGVPRSSDLFHPRQVGAMMGLLLPVFAALLIGRSSRLRVLALPICLATGLVMLLTQSAQAILGAAAALSLVLAWRSRWFWLLVPLVALGAVWGVSQVGAERLRNTALSADNAIGIAVVLRMDMWSRSFAMLRDMPFTGIGINTFPTIQSAYYPGYGIGPEPHSHHFFIQTALDLGLPGLFALIWLLGAFFFLCRRRYRAGQDQTYRALMVGLACGVVAFLLNGLFDAVTLGAKPIFILWGMFGLVAALPHVPTAVALEPQSLAGAVPAWRSAFLTPLMLVVAGVLLGMWARPSAWAVNQALVHSHRWLLPFASTMPAPSEFAFVGLTEVKRDLTAVLRADPANAQALLELARAQLWLGEHEAAIALFQRVAALESENPRFAYLPSERLLRETLEETRGEQLALIYEQWLARFPDRAEGYVRAALVVADSADLNRARGLVAAGLKAGAEPMAALVYLDSVLAEAAALITP
jgi:hypothetical protein